MSQCRVPPASTGSFANRLTSCSSTPSFENWAAMIRPLAAPRSPPATVTPLVTPVHAPAPVPALMTAGSPEERGGHAGVDWDQKPCRQGEVAADEGEDGGGDVLGQYLFLQQGALGVVGAELGFVDAVDGGALGAPAAGEDAAAADHAVGVDAVDADADGAELGGEQAYLVSLVGLGGAVGDVGRAGEYAVLGDDVDDVAAHALRVQQLRGLAGDEERAARHLVVQDVPVGEGGLGQRLGDGQARVVDHQVDAAEGEGGRRERRSHLVLTGDVGAYRDRRVRRADPAGDGRGCRRVPVGDDHAGALGGKPLRGGPADAGATAGGQGAPAPQGL